MISANSANAHAETTTASASTETSNAAKASTVSTSSGLVVGKTGTSNESTAAAGTTAGTQSSASSTATKTAAQATTSSSNSSSNFTEEHKDLLDRAKADGITITKDESKTYNNQEDADKDIADQASTIKKKLDEYESVKDTYDKANAAYQEAEAAYEKAQSSSDSHIVKDISQSLTYKQETGATLDVNAKNYIKASAWNDGDNNSVYTKSNVTKDFSSSDLTTNKAEATVTDKSARTGQTYTGVKMSTGETITATYTNLKNSVYVDAQGTTHKISKVVYSIKLEKSTTKDGTANVFLSNNPNNAFWYAAKNENNGSVEFSITPTFYDESGNKLNMTNAWFSMSSLNNSSNGTEYFNPESNQAKVIPGSSVAKHDDGSFYSDNDNSADKAGIEWDSLTSANRYYGAALMQLNGSEFKVGTKTKEGQDVYAWLNMDSSLATAYKPVKLQDAPTKPTISYHDVSVVTPQEPAVTTQYASVKYIDATTGKVLKVDKLNGASGSKSGYKTSLLIKKYKSMGYILESDDTDGQEIIFDNDSTMDQDYVVKLSHRMDKKMEKHTATRTINLHEPNGVKKVKQNGTVTRTVTTDAVTGEKTYGDWSKAKWDEFKSPKVKGYTASKDKAAKKTVYGDTKNDTVDIYYKKLGVSVQLSVGSRINSINDFLDYWSGILSIIASN